ncbi:extracellular solute-binding protein [Sphingorhabdus sp. EL138]|uniref:extracellular solute-binding protein n=1 Tax=Sphingorhabdus sp. EL138 TaxID=2073156 RepID=UPI000D68E43F|nr:extracellular solute-binding protein [Sphingorhabdus sp. EL138]
MRFGIFGLVLAILGLSACSDGTPGGAGASDGKMLVVFSSRHYDSDYALYDAFEEATGVEVRTIEADGDLLVERLKADGERSPADVIVTVDAGRLWRAEQEQLFAPLSSEKLDAAVPAGMRHPDGLWYGLAKRARVLVYAPDRVDETKLTGYESLADPAFKGKVCARSSGNIYNISLLAALIDRWGEEKAQDWASNVAGNFARDPLGGDTDQIKAVAAGECDIALVNHYYFARLMNDEKDKNIVEDLAVYWPNADAGVHVNLSGAGVAKNAPNPELARQFIEFAMTEQPQRFFAELTNEYPVVPSVEYKNAALEKLGDFKEDPIALSKLGENQAEAQKLFDRAGWP